MSKNNLSLLFILSIVVLPAFGCHMPGTKLPTMMPKDLTIELYEGGGMQNKSETIFLSIDSSYVEYNNYGARNKIYLAISKTELEQLYSVFFDNNFGGILTKEEETHDRGGTSVSLRWNDNYVHKNNSGSTYISNADEDNYKTVVDAIYNLVNLKINVQKQDLTIILDKSITDLNKIISYSINETDSYNSEQDSLKEKKLIRILSGHHHLDVYLTNNTQPSYMRQNHAYLQEKINIEKKHSSLLLYFENDSIKYKLE